MVPDAGVFLLRDPAVQPGDGNMIAGNILAHEADGGSGRQIVPDPGEKLHAFPGEARKDQMADQDPPGQDSVFAVPVRPGLADHFQNGGGSGFKVVRRAGAQLPRAGGIMLEIRQVYIHGSFKHPERFNGFITGGVPDDRDRRTPKAQRFQDLGDKRSAGDKRDRMHPLINQALQRVRKLPGREGASGTGMGDFSVLAVDTPEGAPGKKDGAGPFFSGNGRFLPQVRRNPGNAHFFSQAAEPRTHCAVSPALPGTERTDHNIPPFFRMAYYKAGRA